mmetsp:Transcript_50733/g.108636  ORF Transcript_50733/g.108636 Transcript_50733/m.108636 type:complete len:367 (+) Transcript_50733:85-1185(+)
MRRLVEEHSGGDRHGHQLLEHQLTRIWHVHLRHPGPRASLAIEAVLGQIGNRKQPTSIAQMDTVGVTHVHKSLLEELRGTVAQHAITFHLTEAQPSHLGSALHGLPHQHGHRPSCSRMDLILDHVLQPLVVGGGHENLRWQPLPGVAVVHDLISVTLPPQLVKSIGHILNSHLGERCGIAFAATQRPDLAQNGLGQMPNGHSRRYSVRIHHQIRDDTVLSEGHVLVPKHDSHCPLLSVTGREFVSDGWDLVTPHPNLGKFEPVLTATDHHTVHAPVLSRPQTHGAVFVLLVPLYPIVLRWQLRDLTNQHIITQASVANLGNTVLVEFGVIATLQTHAFVLHVRDVLEHLATALFHGLFGHIAPIKH